jgi:hypothetical protein
MWYGRFVDELIVLILTLFLITQLCVYLTTRIFLVPRAVRTHVSTDKISKILR